MSHGGDSLTTNELYQLSEACRMIADAYGAPYLVGSTMLGGEYRDVDVRLILPDDEFDTLFGVEPDGRGYVSKWELLSLALGDYLRIRTGLPVDFQIQRRSEANQRHEGLRNPLGIQRIFAGGGDGTPWTRPAVHDAVREKE